LSERPAAARLPLLEREPVRREVRLALARLVVLRPAPALRVLPPRLLAEDRLRLEELLRVDRDPPELLAICLLLGAGRCGDYLIPAAGAWQNRSR
jgi:hypothetical protein